MIKARRERELASAVLVTMFKTSFSARYAAIGRKFTGEAARHGAKHAAEENGNYAGPMIARGSRREGERVHLRIVLCDERRGVRLNKARRGRRMRGIAGEREYKGDGSEKERKRFQPARGIDPRNFLAG